METDFEHDFTRAMSARPWRAELAVAAVVLIAVVIVALLAGDADRAEGRGTPAAGSGQKAVAISVVEQDGTARRVPASGATDTPALI